jgi:hypothetical protein
MESGANPHRHHVGINCRAPQIEREFAEALMLIAISARRTTTGPEETHRGGRRQKTHTTKQ